MKAFFKELFEYNFTFNQKSLHVLVESDQHISKRLIELYSHIVNVHAIWNNKIVTEVRNYKSWEIHDLQDLIKIDNENFDSSIAIIHQFELDSEIEYTTSTGKLFHNSIRDILFQIINHSTYHRGQIATEFRQCKMEPLLTDWIFYKMT